MKFLSVLFLLALAPLANAETEMNHHDDFAPTWEISGGAAANFAASSVNDTTASQTYSVSGDLDYFMLPQVEFGTRASFGMVHQSGVTTTGLYVLLGPTYNFSSDIENSPFVQARAGIYTVYTGTSSPNSTAFAYMAALGKRFELVRHISFMPEVVFVGNTSSANAAATHAWGIIPVQFSLAL